MNCFKGLFITTYILLLVSCGVIQKTTISTNSQNNISKLNSLLPQNLENAPDFVKEVSDAVYRISLPGGVGTGFFVSSTGYFMTNNHVLGIDSCAKPGCKITLYQNYQRGKKYVKLKLYAVPIVASSIYDFALYQIKNIDIDSNVSTNFMPSHHIKIVNKNVLELQGSDVYVVGHPRGKLKKWTKGMVYTHRDNNIIYNSLTIQGNSGSPVVNSNGEMVAILHAAALSTGERISPSGYNFKSIATSTDALFKVFDTSGFSLDKTYNDVSSVFKKSLFSDLSKYALNFYDIVYPKPNAKIINAITLPAQLSNMVNKKSNKMVTIAASTCDRIINSKQAHDANSFSSSMRIVQIQGNCLEVSAWFNCKANSTPYEFCPTKKERLKWIDRMYNASLLIKNLKGRFPIEYLLNAVSKLIIKNEDYLERTLTKYLNSQKPHNSFNLTYLAISNLNKKRNYTYKEYDFLAEVLNFSKIKLYQRFYLDIIKSHYKLANDTHKTVSVTRLEEIINNALNDDQTSLAQKIDIEEFAYYNNIIK